MSGRANQPLTLPRLAAAAAALAAGLFLLTAALRLTYPYDLDFVENGLLLEAWQHALGRPVYVAPNADFMPNVYMPLYPWLGGGLLTLTGVAYWPLRLLSSAAALWTAGLVRASRKRPALAGDRGGRPVSGRLPPDRVLV